MIPLLLHTHSEYSFIWKATIGLLLKYASNYTIYWCSDELCGFELPSNFIYHQYDPKLNWSQRIKPLLEKIDSKYLIYVQEDYLLVDYMDKEKIDHLLTKGHDWAEDHVAASLENIQQVYDWVYSEAN